MRQKKPRGVELPASQAMSRRAFMAQAGALVGAGAIAAACGDDGPSAMTPDALEPDADSVAFDTATPPDAGAIDGGPDAEVQADDVAPPELFDPASVGLAPESVFIHGVQSGDPTPSSVVFQCVYRGAGALSLVVLTPDPGGLTTGPMVVLQRVVCEVTEVGFVYYDVQSLPAGARGFYCFVSSEGRSPMGEFKTAPAPDARTRVVFGATSCASYTYRPFDVLTTASRDELDFFVLLGDTVYADDASTREAYRDLWSRNLSRLEYKVLLAAQPVIATWDDHEVDNNWDPETVDPTRLAAARGAFFEHLAVRPDPFDPDRIYRSFRFGALVELFVLDCRSYRRPSTRKTGEAQYLGEAQAAWLIAGLGASDATFKLVANSIPITKCPALYPGDSQRWEGYAAARDAMITATKDVSGLVWLAGDFHFGAIARVDPPAGAAHGVTEVLVGPVAHLNPALSIIELSGSPEQFVFTTAERNYGRFVAEDLGNLAVLTVEHVGTAGQILSSQRIAEIAR